MQSFISMGVVTVIWVLVGYSLAFSGNVGGLIGNFSWWALNGVGIKPGPWAPHIPALAHFIFQEMFAIITPALIIGAFVGLGTGLLWFGWFGFNGGSALAANGVAAQAFVNTDIAASVAMCTWTAISWWRAGKPSIIGAFTGAVAGLACITPCAGFVPTWAAFVIGFLAGVICYLAVALRDRMHWDDALDVWAAHGVGGLLGSILLGAFAYLSVNAAGSNGLVSGDAAFFGKQVAAAVLVAVYAFVVTWIILKVIDHFEPVRVPDAMELAGLDTEMQEQTAYELF